MHLFLIEDIGFVLMGVLMFLVSTSTLWWMLHDWNGAAQGEEPLDSRLSKPEPQSFSLIVPARHEEEVLEETLFRMGYLEHARVEVIVVVGDDDAPTRAVAERVAAVWPERFRVVVDDSRPKSKPTALNRGIAHCRGSVVGIFDAEDEVSPEILNDVEGVFQRSGADVVQSGVQLVDLDSHWFSLRNCLEYFFWYRSRMHAHALQGVMPLGGNTVFFRRQVIEAVGGWDDGCLAEDCEIGMRLSARGCPTAVLYDPHTATREETPPNLGSLFRQRTRWNQGFLQVLRKRGAGGFALARQRAFARYLLAFPFLQALSAVLLPVSLTMVLFVKLPVGVTLAAFLPLIATIVTTAVELVALRELCRDFYLRLRLRDYLVLVLSTVPYQVVLSLAAFRAVGREMRGVRSWEKTAHLGSHRVAVRPDREASAA
ncbi:MAG: glycosyl transferase, family 2 [Acidimicrobiaceae bacterium]|nr:glycosyl transferase, family 2 [Acidimicrobiaceae bacterium]